MTDAVQCDRCGGIVAYDAAKEAVRCLFCGDVDLAPYEGEEAVVLPADALPFRIGAVEATRRFGAWSRLSWWYPKALRHLKVGIDPVWIPAWRFRANVETHWAGLTAAPTKSGKKPIAGRARGHEWAMVPASLGLAETELTRLMPFGEADGVAWSAENTAIPYEVPTLSYAAAVDQARAAIERSHRRAIARSRRLSQCRTSSLFHDVEGRLLMLPIYVGGFRYRDQAYRFVINARTGSVVGRAPIDRAKVAFALAAALMVVAALLLWLEPWR